MDKPIYGVTVGTGMNPQAAIEKTEQAEQIKKNAEDIEKLSEEIVDEIESRKNAIKELSEQKANVIVDSANGNNIVIKDSTNEKLRGMRLFGKSTQLSTTGAQLIDFSAINPINGSTVAEILDDGKTVKVTGFKAYGSIITQIDVTDLVGKTIYLSGSISGGIKTSYTLRMIKTDGSDKYITNARDGYTILEDDKTLRFQFIINNTATDLESEVTVTFTETMLSLKKDIPWEPFTGRKAVPNLEQPQSIESVGDDGSVEVEIYGTDVSNEPQSLIVYTPNGLLGIPVTESNIANYTDSDGNMWCCDEIDFERGKYVQNVVKSNGADMATAYLSSNGKYAYFTPKYGAKFVSDEKISPILCNIARNNSNNNIDNGRFDYGVSVAKDGRIHYRNKDFTTADEYRAVIKSENFEVVYILSEPIERDLTAEEIEAYKVLHTNYPTTTVTSDAFVEIDYVADTKNYIDNKFAELKTAIIALGGV